MGRVGAIGRTPLTDRFAGLVPGWSTMVNAPDRQLFLGKMPFRRPSAEAAAALAPDVTLPDTPSYLRWVMMIPPEYADTVPELEGDPVAALTLLRDLVNDWHPDLRALFDEPDATNSGIGPLRISDPIRPWPTRAITLLGDAAHPAPPGGLGANLAFVDSELLCRKLVAVNDGTDELIPRSRTTSGGCAVTPRKLLAMRRRFSSRSTRSGEPAARRDGGDRTPSP